MSSIATIFCITVTFLNLIRVDPISLSNYSYGTTLGNILEQLSAMQEEMQHLSSIKANTEARFDNTNKEIIKLNDKISYVNLKNNGTTVAFTAHAEAPQELNDTDILQFTGVTTNIGGHYNASTGEFTCPYHGIYNFNVVIFTRNDYNLRIGVFRDSGLLIRIYCNKNDFDQSGQTIVVECQAGQVIRSVVYENDGETMELSGSSYSTFSGALLHLL